MRSCGGDSLPAPASQDSSQFHSLPVQDRPREDTARNTVAQRKCLLCRWQPWCWDPSCLYWSLLSMSCVSQFYTFLEHHLADGFTANNQDLVLCLFNGISEWFVSIMLYNVGNWVKKTWWLQLVKSGVCPHPDICSPVLQDTQRAGRLSDCEGWDTWLGTEAAIRKLDHRSLSHSMFMLFMKISGSIHSANQFKLHVTYMGNVSFFL